MKKFIPFLIISLATFFFYSCEEKSDPKLDEQTFTKIYSNSEFSTAYYPLDIKQTNDGGYLILSEKKLYDSLDRLTYLLKVDKYGSVVKEIEVDASLTNPVPTLMAINNKYYFFCMKGTDDKLAVIDSELTNYDTIPLSAHLPYPAASSYDGANFELLSYDYDNRQFLMSVISPTGAAQPEVRFDIEAANQIEGPIIDHFLHTGKRFPFQVGKLSNTYYFNAFYNYTFSLVFTNLSGDNSVQGIIQGQSNSGGMNSIVQISATQFAASSFNYGSNYFLPKVTISTGATVSSTDLAGNPMPELVADAPVKIIQATANAKNILIYASNTKSNQIGLYVFEESTGTFLGSKYLGFSNPFEVANVIQTADGGLAVCGSTYTAGRFSRICIFKISKADLEGLVK